MVPQSMHTVSAEGLNLQPEEQQVYPPPNNYASIRDALLRLGIKATYRAIQSDNFTNGSIGWQLTAEGRAYLNEIFLYSNSVNAITLDYGSDILLKHGGDINFTEVTKPTACTAALIETAGNMDVGTHHYEITYVNDSGETEGSPASNTVTVDVTHKQVSLTNIPTSSSSSVTSRKIYRTNSGGGYHRYIATISDNTTTTYTDNIADVAEGTAYSENKENTTFGKILVNGNVVAILGQSLYLGKHAGNDSTRAFYNVGIGQQALGLNTLGYSNTAVGHWSLGNNLSGYMNTAVGDRSLTGSSHIGMYNVAMGYEALYVNKSGNMNISVGRGSLKANITGDCNTAVGDNAMKCNIIGEGNIAIGSSSLYFCEAGNSNVAIGGGARIDSSSGVITAFSDYSGTVAGTVKVTSAGHGLVGAVSNIEILETTNYNSGISLVTVTKIDDDNFYFTHSWDGDDATGYWRNDDEGSRNIFIGKGSGSYNYSGMNNVIIGYNAGWNASGSDNVIIGYKAGYDETASNKLFIDNQDRGSEANGRTKSLIYGVFNSTQTDQSLRLTASVGINTADFGSGKVVLAIANASTVPSANPTGGGVIYWEGGALKYRGSSGTITTLANA